MFLKENIEYNICMCTKYNNDCRKKMIVDKEITGKSSTG